MFHKSRQGKPRHRHVRPKPSPASTAAGAEAQRSPRADQFTAHRDHSEEDLMLLSTASVANTVSGTKTVKVQDVQLSVDAAHPPGPRLPSGLTLTPRSKARKLWRASRNMPSDADRGVELSRLQDPRAGFDPTGARTRGGAGLQTQPRRPSSGGRPGSTAPAAVFAAAPVGDDGDDAASRLEALHTYKKSFRPQRTGSRVHVGGTAATAGRP